MASPRDFLRAKQNADGGWGYFPGKRSWLEPTVYAALALDGEPEADRALELIRSWALPMGGWRTSADVAEANWTSALALHYLEYRGQRDESTRRGLALLLRTLGMEGSFRFRLVQRLKSKVKIDSDLQGWPWRTGSASWVEPTVHSLLALRRVRPKLDGRAATIADSRLQMAQRMLLSRQCFDGGWNYGNTLVLDEQLPSYAETTGLALIGLQGASWDRREDAVARLGAMNRGQISALGSAWRAIATRVGAVPAASGDFDPRQDVVLNALSAVATSERAWRFFQV